MFLEIAKNYYLCSLNKKIGNMNDFEIIMASITGVDKPGLTSQLAAIIAKYGATILDIGQADIHSSLSLGIMFKSDKSASGSILKEIIPASENIIDSSQHTPISRMKVVEALLTVHSG